MTSWLTPLMLGLGVVGFTLVLAATKPLDTSGINISDVTPMPGATACPASKCGLAGGPTPQPTPPDCVKQSTYNEEKGYCVPKARPAPKATAAPSDPFDDPFFRGSGATGKGTSSGNNSNCFDAFDQNPNNDNC